MEPTASGDNPDFETSGSDPLAAVVDLDLRCGLERQVGRALHGADFDVVAGPKPDHVLIRSPGDLNDPQLAAGLRSSFDQTAAAYRRDGALVVGRVEFSPTYGEPCVEAPRPPALPEHPAIAATMALGRASAMDRQRKIAAQLLVDLGVSDEAIGAAVARLTDESGAFPQMTAEMHVRAVFDAVLAEILA